MRWTSFVRLWNVALCFPCADSWPDPRCLYNQVLIHVYFFNPFNQLRACVRLLIHLRTQSASYCSVGLDTPAARRLRSSTLPCELQRTTCSGSSFNVLSPRRSRRRHVVLHIFKTVSQCMYRMSYWILSRQLMTILGCDAVWVGRWLPVCLFVYVFAVMYVDESDVWTSLFGVAASVHSWYMFGPFYPSCLPIRLSPGY